jgi:hypothetical protein
VYQFVPFGWQKLEMEKLVHVHSTVKTNHSSADQKLIKLTKKIGMNRIFFDIFIFSFLILCFIMVGNILNIHSD